MFERLLFRLRIIKNLTIQRDRNGRAMVTLHRTDNVSHNIRPDIPDVRSATIDGKTFIANGVDPITLYDFTGRKVTYTPGIDVKDSTLERSDV